MLNEDEKSIQSDCSICGAEWSEESGCVNIDCPSSLFPEPDTENKWMVMVSPLKGKNPLFVQRGKLCDSPEEAEEERKEWAKVYRQTKVQKCRPIDIKMYGGEE